MRALLLPYYKSSPASKADAMRVVEALGIDYRVMDITAAVHGLYEAKGVSIEDVPGRTKGNVMARMRMIFGYEECERWARCCWAPATRRKPCWATPPSWGG